MKEKTAFLIPMHNLIVRDPLSMDPLAKTGEVKPLVGPEGRYWRRRLKDGTVKIKVQKKNIRSRKANREEG